ncbi:MAG TPA: AIR synthase-related protein [Methanoregulaceae archaeon]|nr:AIR synthase-related protein [Methanoregulaceae archaeon]HQJ39625.1 AIR synthase-related protein [Methanoregulaceae archaeon]HQN90499.1 AIR synthase-related protein [Methanoregulaceae archaeon]
MDVEEYVRRGFRQGISEEDLRAALANQIRVFKPEEDQEYTERFAQAVINEVKNSTGIGGDFFSYHHSGVSMGEFGVGSRGSGDFFAHRQIARVIGRTRAAVGVDEMDDGGVVEVAGTAGGRYIVCAVDGMHSRLSDFPFLAGFHATRATLRDAYVMGARPILLFSDIHVADDGDVAKIFEYTAGITTVGEMMGVPLVSGSTLRIGGDMVLGERMTGCVGTVGIARHLTPRKSAAPGDVILMTEGAGGGTIATAAIYSGFPEVVERTINLQFLKAVEALLGSPVIGEVHAMTDVTNGGLRGDAHELAQTAGCRVVIVEDRVRGIADAKVQEMLDALAIDYLGVSLDSLLIVAPGDTVPALREVISDAGVRIEEIGRVEQGSPGAYLVSDGKEQDFSPRFRESAYTPVKKVVDRHPADLAGMKMAVEKAAEMAIEKKRRIIRYLSSVS